MELRMNFPVASSKSNSEKSKVLNAICAILNSSKEGGELILSSGSSAPYSQENADDITRKIEQRLLGTFGFEASREIFNRKPSEEMNELCFEITPTELLPAKLCTINYNLFFTTEAQVSQVPSSEGFQRIVKIIKGEHKREQKFVLGTHCKEFSLLAKVSFEENKETQFKLLKDETLAKRITDTNNKLIHYVSSFANGSGGHIYYGIQLDENGSYVVYGQTVKDAGEIIENVDNAIYNLFVWPHEKGCLKKGEQWDIFFEKVSNCTSTEQPKFVIVISVNSYERGVFAKEPESYHIVNENPERLDFQEWRQRFLMADYRNIFEQKLKLLRRIGRCEWSSPEARTKHSDVLKRLVLFRNDGNHAGFTEYKEKLLSDESSLDVNTKCLIQQQEAANFFRERLLVDAECKLKENENFLNSVPTKGDDFQIYQIRMLYWMGVVKRAQGIYKECQTLCEQALQTSHHQPNILVVPWLFYNKAKTLEIDIATQGADCSKDRSLRTACLEFYENALRSSFALQDFPENLVVDLQQRVLIGMARLLLGAFFDGVHVVRKTCLPTDIEHADYILSVLSHSVKERGFSMTKLSKAEYQLVRAERYYRRWRECTTNTRFIKCARKKSKKALESAEEKRFKDVCDFARAQIEYFKDEFKDG